MPQELVERALEAAREGRAVLDGEGDAQDPMHALDLGRAVSVVERARFYLDTATELATEPVVAASRIVARADAAAQAATAAFGAAADAVVAKAADLLKPLRNMPVNVNPFVLLRSERRERSFQGVLAWLLDPNGSHELGDRFARRFFARAGITFGGRVFDFGTPLDLVVVEEFSWQVPSEAKVFGDEPTRSLRCDLLAVLGRDVVPIELKVDSYESAYDVDGGRWAQAALYTAVMEAVCHPRRVDHGMAWRQCVRASAYSTEVGRGTNLWSRLERCQCARGIIVHMAEGCLKQHEGAGVENRRDVRHIEWIDAVAILADLRAQRGFALDVDHLTLAFGQAVLERIPVGEYTIMEATEELRMRCAERLLLTRFPVRTVVEVERLRRALSARASCHVKWDTRFNGGLSSAR